MSRPLLAVSLLLAGALVAGCEGCKSDNAECRGSDLTVTIPDVEQGTLAGAGEPFSTPRDNGGFLHVGFAIRGSDGERITHTYIGRELGCDGALEFALTGNTFGEAPGVAGIINAPASGGQATDITPEDLDVEISIAGRTLPLEWRDNAFRSTDRAVRGERPEIRVQRSADQCVYYSMQLVVNCTPEAEAACTDGVDDDNDGLVDCADPDCCEDAACADAPDCGGGETDEVCDDGVDNDGDGATDCADPDCFDEIDCFDEEICDDGVDNDSDFLIDCDDPDCNGTEFCPEPTDEICDDGVDNDGDGAADCDDDDCAVAAACAVDVCDSGATDVESSLGARWALPGLTPTLRVAVGPTDHVQQMQGCRGGSVAVQPGEFPASTWIAVATAAQLDAATFEDLYGPAPTGDDPPLVVEFDEDTEYFIAIRDPEAAMCMGYDLDLAVDTGDGLDTRATNGETAFSAAPGTDYSINLAAGVAAQIEVNPPEAGEEECPIAVTVAARDLDTEGRGVTVSTLSGPKIAQAASNRAIAEARANGTYVDTTAGLVVQPLVVDPQAVEESDDVRGRFVLNEGEYILKRDDLMGSCARVTFRYERRCDIPPACVPLDCGNPACAEVPECGGGDEEICDNGTDDDGDSRVDCEDDDCADVCCAASAPGAAPNGYGDVLTGWLVESATAPPVGLCFYDACDQFVGFDAQIFVNQPLWELNRFDSSSLFDGSFLYPQPVPSATRVRTVAYAPDDLIDEPNECPPTFDAGLTEYANIEADLPDWSGFSGTPIVIGAGTPDAVCGAGRSAPCPAERAPALHVFETTCSAGDDVARVRIGNFIPNSGDLSITLAQGDTDVATLSEPLPYGQLSEYTELSALNGDQVLVTVRVEDAEQSESFDVGTFDFQFDRWNVTERVRTGQCVLIALHGAYGAGVEAAAMLESPNVCSAWGRSNSVPPDLYPGCVDEE